MTASPSVRLFADHVMVTSSDGVRCDVRETLVPLIALRTDGLDPAAVAEARRVIERLGAVDLACVDAIAAPDGCAADYVVDADGDAHGFCAFTSRAQARWQALGWRVEVDAAYPFHVRAHEPSWYARVEPDDERPDWFGLELGVVIDGANVDLLRRCPAPRVARLQNSLDALVATRQADVGARIDDGGRDRAGRSPAPCCASWRALPGRARGAPCVPEARAASLVELDAAFERSGARLAWKDRAGVVERARSHAAPLRPVAAPDGLQATLRPYQSEGVAFLSQVADEQGERSGRRDGPWQDAADDRALTAQSTSGRLDAPALVVAPTTLVGNWAH